MEYNELGIKALQEGAYEKAIEAFMKAAEEEPDNPVGYINIANVFASLGDTERAERFFQKAITLDENAGSALYGLGNLYFTNDRFEEAAKLYEKAIRAGLNEADAFFMLGKSLKQSGNSKLALPYFQRAAELAPDDLEIRLAYGILLAEMELFEEAGKELRFILEKDEANVDAHYNIGVLYAVSTNRKEDAIHHLEKAFTLEPEHTQARYIYDMIKMGEQS
ncbi:tetratricopeptide repeat protein [Sporosarcina thermotolerans]|uniref:Tetratricopeptide repeat protein n=1 Tax=Sporosarcina thermotolerans TaxID=633404 RepID=A0AAW9AE71_9BACL|nr:tetratricopeptide repeat protein [Sporosarcina thermotolerans]MDW0117431.1 tetratricopeptide repeat protein [Sporosarcina thermotolerans]WHT47562.1 tetratricopeptide repeat protein [Sporosarcina thermotolerans]